MSAAKFRKEFTEETSYVEFKQGISSRKLSEALVGFSNADGGVVFVGVTKTGKVVGVDGPGERERELHDALVNVLNPGRYSVQNIRIGTRDVLVLCIERRQEGFAQTSDGVILQRKGARNEPLKGQELSRYVQQRAFTAFELTPTNIRWSSVSEEDKARASRSWSVKPSALRKRLLEGELLVHDKGHVVLTVAGALTVASRNHEKIGRTGIEVLRYTGDEAEPDMRWPITGTVDAIVRETEQVILGIMGRQSVLVGLKRFDMERLPQLALREAIANAVAHRSYEAKGTWTRIEVRSTGVEIRSPGVLPEPVTPENIREQQSARNPNVLAFLYRVGLAEDLGRGIDRIEDEMATELLEAPRFEEGPSWFQVVLPVSGTFAPEERAWILEMRRERTLNRRDAQLIVHAGRVGSVTNTSARNWLGLDRDETRLILQRLRDEKILVQHGFRGGTSYSLATDLGMPSPERLTRDAQMQILLDLAKESSLTNTGVRDRLGIDRSKAADLLRALVDQGKLIQVGERRGTRYQLPG